MVRLVKKKVAASSLIEVLIAMVIILIVFTIAIKIFNNVVSSSVSFRNVKVQSQLDLLAKQVEDIGYVETEVLQIEDISYEFVVKMSEVNDVAELEIRATQTGKFIGSIRTLFKIHADEKN